MNEERARRLAKRSQGAAGEARVTPEVDPNVRGTLTVGPTGSLKPDGSDRQKTQRTHIDASARPIAPNGGWWAADPQGKGVDGPARLSEQRAQAKDAGPTAGTPRRVRRMAVNLQRSTSRACTKPQECPPHGATRPSPRPWLARAEAVLLAGVRNACAPGG